MKKKILVFSLLVLSGVLTSCGNESILTTSKESVSSDESISINTSGYTSSGAIEVSSNNASYSNYNFVSSKSDESVIKVDGSSAKALICDSLVTKSGDTSSADNSSFYGLNASMLSTAGNLYAKNVTVNSTAEGGAGLCAAKSGAVAYGYGMNITTSKNSAGGFHVCNDGTLYGYNSTINTSGEHSAAIRSDRGGGTMEIEKGTYKSTGSGSPAIYCTADISIKDATLSASGSEAFAMEGLNTTSLFNSTLEGSCPASSQNSNIQWNVICYQSMSGDSETGAGRFNMVGGKLIANKGGMFFGTNTDAEFYINDVDLEYSSDNPFLLRATGISRWKNSYSAMKTHFTAEDQTMNGKIIYDTMSGLTVDLIGSTVWTGSTILDTSFTGSKTSTINIGKNAKWIVNGDSTIANLNNAGTILDSSNKEITIKVNGQTKVSGTSDYSINVTSSYTTSENISNALSSPTWQDLPTFPDSL